MRFLVALLLLGCSGCPAPSSPPPPPAALDASTPCATQCERYRQLDCPEGKPTPKGHTCEEVCENAALHGIALAGQTSCTAAAPTCEAIRNCK